MKRSTLIKAVLTLTFAVCGLTVFTQNLNQETDTRWETLICAISAVESINQKKSQLKCLTFIKVNLTPQKISKKH